MITALLPEYEDMNFPCRRFEKVAIFNCRSGSCRTPFDLEAVIGQPVTTAQGQ